MELYAHDFINSGWRDAIADCSPRWCESFSFELIKASRIAQMSGRDRQAAALEILGQACMMPLRRNNASAPFYRLGGSPRDYKGENAGDFDKYLSAIEAALPEIDEPDLSARMADILWLRRKGQQRAHQAVALYMAAAVALEHPEHWTGCVTRLERALRLAKNVRSQELFDQAIAQIEATIERCTGEDPLYLSERLMDLLCEFKRGDSEKYAALSKKLAARAEEAQDFRRARVYHERTAAWFRQSGDVAGEKGALGAGAATFVAEAEYHLAREKPGHSEAAHFFGNAVTAYRKIRERKIADEIHIRLLEAQKNSVDDMKLIEFDGIDISETVRKATEAVSGKPFYDAILQLISINVSPVVSELRQEAMERVDSGGIQNFIDSVVVNGDGRVVAQRPAVDRENMTDETLRPMMFEAAAHTQTFRVQAIIEPARIAIVKEHTPTLADLTEICAHSPLIPRGRAEIYARGLHAGLIGDWLVAAHLLIPQFEESVRMILGQLGMLASTLESDGTQEERGLTQTLRMTEIKDFFGENIHFDLEGLLISQQGTNLRNRVAHGLLSYENLMSMPVAYCWWLILRLVMLPLIAKQAEASNTEPAQ